MNNVALSRSQKMLRNFGMHFGDSLNDLFSRPCLFLASTLWISNIYTLV